jgi:hypothetical protein
MRNARIVASFLSSLLFLLGSWAAAETVPSWNSSMGLVWQNLKTVPARPQAGSTFGAAHHGLPGSLLDSIGQATFQSPRVIPNRSDGAKPRRSFENSV